MEKFDKIFELLEKSSLNEEETKYLSDFQNSDMEIAKLVNIFRSLQNNMADSIHIDVKTLASYILFENGEEPELKSVLLLSNKIREHLGKCKTCNAEYENLKQEFFMADEYLSNVITTEDKTKKIKTSRYTSFLGKSYFRYAFAALAAIVIAYSGLFIYSNNSIDSYKKGLFDTGTEEVYSTRGRTTLTFQKGLDAVEHENYETAVKFFEEDIEENKNDRSIFYTYYILGITQLHTSEKSFAGLFKSFDEKIVYQGIASLNRSIELNTSGSYENINLDARYYLGRAYLLLDDFDNARKNLNIVVNEKGRFYNEARELIDTISNN